MPKKERKAVFLDETPKDTTGLDPWLIYEVSVNGRDWFRIDKCRQGTFLPAFSGLAPSDHRRIRLAWEPIDARAYDCPVCLPELNVVFEGEVGPCRCEDCPTHYNVREEHGGPHGSSDGLLGWLEDHRGERIRVTVEVLK